MIEQDSPAVDHLTDRGDMPQRHVAMRHESHHRPHPRCPAAIVASLRLLPPGSRVAENLDAGQLAGIGHALKIGRQFRRRRILSLTRRRRAERQHSSRDRWNCPPHDYARCAHVVSRGLTIMVNGN